MCSDRVDFSPRGDEKTADLYSTEHRFGHNEPERGEGPTTGNKYLDFILGLLFNFFFSITGIFFLLTLPIFILIELFG